MKKVSKFTSFVIIPVGIVLFIQVYIIRNTVLPDSVVSTAAALIGIQGVDVKIISGDNSLTVSSIAKKAGLENYESYIDLSTIGIDAEIVN